VQANTFKAMVLAETSERPLLLRWLQQAAGL
jgi:hypothetical protein